MTTHKDLSRNPSLLLQSLIRNKYLDGDGTESARLGAVLNDGINCITTTTCDYIPVPPIGLNRSLRERSDMFFGEEDYLVWPQPYQHSLPHLPFIHRRSEDLKIPHRQFLWILPQKSDFQIADTQIITGMGKLDSTYLLFFCQFQQNLMTRVDAYTEQLDPLESKHLNRLLMQTPPLINRLQSMPMGFQALCRTIRALQRNLLETEALVDYLMDYKAKGITLPHAAFISPTVGVFIHSVQDAARFEAMGICHWLICPYEVALQMRITAVTSIRHADSEGLSTEPYPNSKTIATGAVSDPKMYIAIRDFGMDAIRFPDPFNSLTLPELLDSYAGPMRSDSRHQRALSHHRRFDKSRSDYCRAKHPVGQRSKFEDPHSSLFPPAIPAWSSALVSVDTSKRQIFGPLASDTAYIVPEPASFVSTQTREKSMAMFRAWLVFRSICLLRISLKSSLAQPRHGKAWSALLTWEFAERGGADKPPGNRAQKRTKMREEMVSLMKNCVQIDNDLQMVQDIIFDSSHASWQGTPFDALEDKHFEQILWELHEINFRFEFQALDRRARIDTPFENSHNTDIQLMACFPEHSFAIPPLCHANHGIASTSMRERAHYLFAMARVMKRWKWILKDGYISKNQLRWSYDEIDSLEQEIASTYTQLFFDCFRRAPVTPHRLSDRAAGDVDLNRSLAIIFAPHIENASYIVNSVVTEY